MLAVGSLVVVGEGKGLFPAAAMTVSDACDPATGALAAAVAETESGADLGKVVRPLGDRQLQAGGAGFELSGADAARHGPILGVSGKGQPHARGGWWTASEEERPTIGGSKRFWQSGGIRWSSKRPL